MQMAPLLRLAQLHPNLEGLEPDVAALATALQEWKAEPNALWEKLQRPIGAAVEARVAEQVRAAVGAAVGAAVAARRRSGRLGSKSHLIEELLLRQPFELELLIERRGSSIRGN